MEKQIENFSPILFALQIVSIIILIVLSFLIYKIYKKNK